LANRTRRSILLEGRQARNELACYRQASVRSCRSGFAAITSFTTRAAASPS